MLARPIEGLSIDGSLSYLDFQYTRLAPGTTITLDEPFAGVPKSKWTLGAQYEIPLGGSWGSLTPRVDVSYQDDIYAGVSFEDEFVFIDAYTLANARLTWRNEDEDLSVALEVSNLTDEYYYVHAVRLARGRRWPERRRSRGGRANGRSRSKTF